MKGCVGVCLPSWPYGSHCPRWWFGPEAPLRRELHRSPADFPIFTVVLDNGGWQAVKASVQRVYPGGAAQRTDSLLSQLRTGREGEQRRFIEISCAFGAHGEGVTDPDELDEAIARCLRALGDGRAAVLHVDAIPP